MFLQQGEGSDLAEISLNFLMELYSIAEQANCIVNSDWFSFDQCKWLYAAIKDRSQSCILSFLCSGVKSTDPIFFSICYTFCITLVFVTWGLYISIVTFVPNVVCLYGWLPLPDLLASVLRLWKHRMISIKYKSLFYFQVSRTHWLFIVSTSIVNAQCADRLFLKEKKEIMQQIPLKINIICQL